MRVRGETHHPFASDREGEFWQGESYDHLVRDDEDMHRCCHAITRR